MRLWIFLSLAVAIFHAAPAFSQENEIIWAISDWPPVYVLNKGKTPDSAAQLGEGRSDIVLKEIIARLPNYRHRFIQENIVRTWSSFASGRHQCDAASYKNPEREKSAYFTTVGLGVSVAVIVRKDRLNHLNLASPTVSLAHLAIGRTDLNGYIDAGRSFGASIDAILARDNVNLRRQVETHNGHLLHMLDSERMDYTLENPIVVEYMIRHNQFIHELTIIPIAEVPPIVPIYVACSRNDWGKQAINDIAKAIGDAAKKHTFRETYTDFLPQELAGKYHAQYENFFNDLGKQTEQIK
jgi:uncharacterized protein (TIGR02285 family)